MSTNGWDTPLPPLGLTPREFVRKFAAKLTDADIADQLTEAGFRIANPEAVRSVRRRLNLGAKATETRRAHGVQVEERANTVFIDSLTPRITTLEHLLAACQIDLDTWAIERYVVNKWEVGAKDTRKKLEWKDGILTGTVNQGGITVEPLFQVKVWLVRKAPIALEPVVQPVRIAPPKKRGFSVSPTRRAIVLSDPQIGFRRDLRTGALDPFHDRRALDIALQIASQGADKIIWLGDLLDLADWSDKFIRSPDFYFTTQPAIIEAAWWLRSFAECAAENYLIGGNHEQRLDKSLVTHLSQAYDLRSADRLEMPPVMSVPNLLGLDQLGITYVGQYPDGEVWVNDQVVCEHGDTARNRSGATVSALVEEIQETHLIGHAHRVEHASKTLYTRRGPQIVSAWSLGCLCRLDGVVPGTKAKQNWQQAFGVVDYTDTAHQITPVYIHDGAALFEGQVYQARDRVADLKKDTGWNY